MKRKTVCLLCTLVMLSGCGQVPEPLPIEGNVTGPFQNTNTQTQTNNTDNEKEEDQLQARINQVGEDYIKYLEKGSLYFDTYGVGVSRANVGLKTNALVNSMAVADAAMAPAEFTATDDEGYLSDIYDIQPFNRESYKNIDESGFVSTKTQPFSTFGADVDTASYSELRRKIFENIYDKKQGQEAGIEDPFYTFNGIDNEAVRIEEMINYFDYSYPDPVDGEKFGIDMCYTNCPWNEDTKLLRIGIKTKEEIPENGSNIVFLIDTSGSMYDFDKLPLVQESFDILQQQLTENDRISIVTYAGDERVIAEGLKGNEHEKIKEMLDSLEADGSTNGEGGIKKAYEIAEKYFIEGGNNRVILATDGDLNVGVTSEAGLIKLVEEEREKGVFLSCLGFGTGNYQDDKMEALADHGNGNYAYIDCKNEADKVLKKEMWSTIYTVAKDVKFQTEFNPENVKGYRLIGYENRKMSAEDFSNDKKDGGEVGAGQCVTVLYEVVPADSDFVIPEVTSRYNNNEDVDKIETDTASDELLAVNIRYKEPDEQESKLMVYPFTKDMEISEMDTDTSWAAGVAQLGMLVRGSEYKGTSSFKDIFNRLSKDPEILTDDFKAEFLYVVDKASKDYEDNDEDLDAQGNEDPVDDDIYVDQYCMASDEELPVATKILTSVDDVRILGMEDRLSDELLHKIEADDIFFDRYVILFAAIPADDDIGYAVNHISTEETLTMYADTDENVTGLATTWFVMATVKKDELPKDIDLNGHFALVVDGTLLAE